MQGQIGRYIVRGELGRGAMGVVYRAQDPTIGRTVALKTIRLDVGAIDGHDLLERVRREARAAGVLSHPNIVTIYDAGQDGELFYIAMEAIMGHTLQSRLAQGKPLSAVEAVDIAAQIASGLDYAHSQSVIHRDIKPGNIMLTAQGPVKIMDFGVAKDTGAGLTPAGKVLGTPSYMSPEQVRGYFLDGRSDLFSLGVVLYEIVTGQKPFDGPTLNAVVSKVMGEEPVPPRDLNPQLHPGLEAIILKALAKSPADRYQRGSEMARDLQNYSLLPPAMKERRKAVAGGVTLTVMGTRLVQAFQPDRRRKNATTLQWPSAPEPSVVRPLVSRPLLVSVAALLLVGLAGSVAMPWHPAQTAAELTRSVAARPAAVLEKSTSTALTRFTSVSRKPAPLGELDLQTSPAGAQVSIDGHLRPELETPVTSRLQPGTHRILFRKEGFAPRSEIVQVVSGHEKQVSAVLWPVMVALVLNSTPSGADILLDGKASGRQTPAQLFVEHGRHEVTLLKEGFQPAHALTPPLADGDSFNYAPTLSLDPRRSPETKNR